MGEPSAPSDVVIARVAARAFERDRYLAALLAPARVRDDLIALAAFAGEIGRIAGYVSEPMMGHMRLQWWRDAIGARAATGNPIADRVRQTIARHPDVHGLLDEALDARGRNLDADAPADLAELSAYLDAAEGGLFAAAAIVCSRAPRLDRELTQHAGRAYGLARGLMELPMLLAQGRMQVPSALLAVEGLTSDQLRAGIPVGHTAHQPFMRVVAALSAEARANLRIWQNNSGPPREHSAALLPLALVEPYLRLVERTWAEAGFAIMGPAIDVSPLRRVWTLWRAHRTKRI